MSQCDVCKRTLPTANARSEIFATTSIADVLDMTVKPAPNCSAPCPCKSARKLDTLARVVWVYQQSASMATTLSGGRSERVKLSKELSAPRHRRCTL